MRITDFPLVLEVKDAYISIRRDGNNRVDAVRLLTEKYIQEIQSGAEDDGLLFWVGLADGQVRLKELTFEVAEKGLSAIQSLAHNGLNIYPGDLTRRQAQYKSAPMPEQTVRKSAKKFRCNWSMGDTFAYQLSGEDAVKMGIAGKHILLRKVDALEFGDGRLLPVVTLSLWGDNQLPYTAQDFRKAPFLRVQSRLFGQCTSKMYEYRVEIIIQSKRQLDALGLKYLGNFQDIQMPENEIIYRDPGYVMMLLPKQMDRDCCTFWNIHCQYCAEE